MNNFFNFLSRIGYVFVFITLEGLSLFFIFTQNGFQQSVFFSSANKITGNILSVQKNVIGFFNLKDRNESVMKENAELLVRIKRLEDELKEKEHIESTGSGKEKDGISYIYGNIINNSVSKLYNYITLNVGKNDGVTPETGVVSSDGVVGIVSSVSDNYSVVIPVLNPLVRISCKVKKYDVSCSLLWDGKNRRYAKLLELPNYVSVSKGDTIVTSGYSSIFPEGIIVGYIENSNVEKSRNFQNVKIRLAVEFDALYDIRIINFDGRKELKELIKKEEK